MIALTPSKWIVSNGYEHIHLIRVDPSTLKGQLEATFAIKPSSDLAQRFLALHRANLVGENTQEVLALLSTSRKNLNPPQSQDPQDTDQAKLGAGQSRVKIPSSTSFEYFSVRIPLGGGDKFVDGVLEPEWIVKGDDLPAFVHYDSEQDRYCFASSAPLASIETSSAPKDTRMTVSDQEMTVLQAADPAQLATDPTPSSIPKPPPFSWSQDSASLTVAFPIPSTTPTSSIRITISRLYLTLHIASPSSAVSGTISNFALPRVSHKKWWGDIDPHTSVWTFDREAEGRDSNFGLLTLHLEKQHPGTKWTDVFATTDRPNEHVKDKIQELNEEWDYEEVPETVDPSELAKISEDMEKWTRGIMEGGASHSNEGLGHGVPTSLMGDEMDVEIDADTGRSIVVSWIEPRRSPSGRVDLVTPHASIPYSLLSTSLPVTRSSPAPATSPFDSSITIKHDVDGLLFRAPEKDGREQHQWTHASTFPALAFVLATKRDTKFVYHYRDEFALAFDAPPLHTQSPAGGTPKGGAGNLFVYFAPRSKETKGKQMVLKVGGTASGAVMGVAGVELDGGKVTIVALCERELVVLSLE